METYLVYLNHVHSRSTRLSSYSNSSINRGDCVLNPMTCMVYYILLDPDQS